MIDSQEPAALVLAGGIAKGAFEAGAIERLSAANVRFRRIIGASSGSLNAVFLASAVRAGEAHGAGDALVRLWTHRATWRGFLDVTARGILRGEGLSTTEKLRRLVQGYVRPCARPLAERMPVELGLVITAACGVAATTGPCSPNATSYETLSEFADEDFDDETRLERVRLAAVASATLPGVFTPTHIAGLGPCFDGGLTDNAPISHALRASGSTIETVYVVTPHPAVAPARTPPDLTGLHLVAHLVEILVNERLFRDLREAESRNRAVDRLETLAAWGALDREQLARVREAIGWSRVRRLRIVSIRPREPLPGDALAGFSSRTLRELYIDAGRRAADEALARAAAPDA